MMQRSRARRGTFNGTRMMAALALLFSFLAFLMAGVVMLRTGPEGGGVGANLKAFGEEAGKVFGDLRARIAGGGDAGSGPGTPYSGEADRSGGSAASGEEAEGETGAAAEGAEAGRAETASGEAEAKDGGDGGLQLDAIKKRVDEIETKVRAEDQTAGQYIENLKKDLANLKDLTKDKGGPLLDQISEKLEAARKSLAEDSAEAARRLRELSEDLVRRSREQTQWLMQEREEEDGGSDAARF